jgi:hypothetical protein
MRNLTKAEMAVVAGADGSGGGRGGDVSVDVLNILNGNDISVGDVASNLLNGNSILNGNNILNDLIDVLSSS